MSAGRGVQHSEFNHAPNETTHFLQIWIEPNVTGIQPSYEQKTFAPQDKQGKLRLLASPDGADGSVLIHADARMYGSLLNNADSASLTLDPARKAYVHVVRGSVRVNGEALGGGDALLLQDESKLTLADAANAEVLVFDLQA